VTIEERVAALEKGVAEINEGLNRYFAAPAPGEGATPIKAYIAATNPQEIAKTLLEMAERRAYVSAGRILPTKPAGLWRRLARWARGLWR